MKKLPTHTDIEVAEAIAVAKEMLADAVARGIFDGKFSTGVAFEGVLGGQRGVSFKELHLVSALGWYLDDPGPDGGQRVIYQYDDEKAKAVIKMAIAGDVEADTVLRDAAVKKLQTGLPPNLEEYIAGLLTGRHKLDRRVNPTAIFIRDALIFCVVGQVGKLGFDVSRNEAATLYRASASSIVSTALKDLGVTLSEKTIARIWRESPTTLSENA
jgi:hypothetical protein